MLIHCMAVLPLGSDSLDQALRQMSAYAQSHLVADEHSQAYFALSERGARFNQVLARHLPADAREFYLGMSRVGEPLTAAQFLERTANAKPERSNSLVLLPAFAVSAPPRLIEALADTLPSSGRGIMLLFSLKGWRFRDGGLAADVDLTLSRFRHGKRAIAAGLNLRFQALSLKDPAVKQTISAASERAGVTFGKPMAAFAGSASIPMDAPAAPAPSDERLKPPAPEAQLVVLQAFEEVLTRSSDEIHAQPSDLNSLQLLFSRSGGFDKRMQDVMAGKKESVNLPSRLRRFMREEFPDYGADAADAEQVWFRRPLAPTLDLLLMFDKVHQWGLGKTFTVEFGVDFPNTPFGGMHTGMGGSRRNIFWMFHEGWEKQVWAYTTKAELETALASCATLLRRALPALERHCRDLLLPVPTMLPAGIEQRGPLTAREAYALVLPMAGVWAADVELENVNSVNIMSAGFPLGSLGSSIGPDGRLLPSGSWGFKFLSRRLDRYVYYTVPHTGRVWWSFYPVLQGAIPKYSSVLSVDEKWLDSSEVAPRASAALEHQLRGFRVHQFWLALHDPQRYTGNFVWEARCISHGGSVADRRDVTIQFDRRTGEPVTLPSR